MSRKKEEIKEDLRQKIVTTAERIFASRGFAGTRIIDIAQEAGVNPALVHYYCVSKEKLYQEVLAKLFAEWTEQVQSMAWNGKEPEQVLCEYVKTHFQFQRSRPSLYKMFQWEALEGKNLFQEYESAFWLSDYLDKVRVIESWKRAGRINPHVNERTFPYLMWGMMNQFYYRTEEELQDILGENKTAEQIADIVIDQMNLLLLKGIAEPSGFQDSSLPTATHKLEMKHKEIVLFAPDLDKPGNHALAAPLIEKLQMLSPCSLLTKQQPDSFQGDGVRKMSGCFFLLATRFGELSEPMAQLLALLEQSPSILADQYTGIWVLGEPLAARPLNDALEQQLNRLGAFVLPRYDGQAPMDYITRFFKFIS